MATAAKKKTTPRRALIDDDAPEATTEKKADESDRVTVRIPRGFILTDDLGRPFTYARGIEDMPRAHAEHWYSKANGVEIVSK